MIITDRIYGKFKINSPVIVELIRSKPMQRLKGIAQYGVPDEFYHMKGFSRFDHSIGVMLLLKKFGSSEKEQIAGLLHDVSHTAFSHTIDWVLADSSSSGGGESFQDENHQKYIEESDIASILRKYGYDPKDISTYEKFTLLEQPIPGLCADRIDYCLRELDKRTIEKLLSSLTTTDHRFLFKTRESSRIFAYKFLGKQAVHWGGFEAAARWRLFANVLRRALDLGITTLGDFWKDDAYVVAKLKKIKDPIIQRTLSVMRNKSLSNLPRSDITVVKKFRYVDPEFLSNSKIVRLSEQDKKFARFLEEARVENSKGVVVPQV